VKTLGGKSVQKNSSHRKLFSGFFPENVVIENR